jgi:superoxide dismutase, Cu-Zn family
MNSGVPFFGKTFALAICGTALMIGCATDKTDKPTAGSAQAGAAKARLKAVAVLAPGTNSNVRGQVTFQEEMEGVRVTANVEGLTPGKHGFHIHDKGDCSSADFTSAGGHFNPTAAKHGSPTDAEHHAGDFGNIEANQQGVAQVERVFSWLTFKGTNSILNRAVIVHEKADDLTTQPTGNAGGRLACGVIKATP